LKAVSHATVATDSRMQAAAGGTPDTVVSQVGERTRSSGITVPLRHLPRWAGKHRWLAIGGAIAIALVLAAGFVPVSMVKLPPAPKTSPSEDSQETIAEKPGWHGWPPDAPPPAIAPFDAAQAKRHQVAWAKYLKVPVDYENTIGMKFRL